jgi:formamidopyrimidine-DNA glycosylase
VPELPDVTVYVEKLRESLSGEPLERVRVVSPFVLRSHDPPLDAVFGRRVRDVRRLGKRIVFELEGELFMVVHLMIAGRLRWREHGAPIPKKTGLLAFDFPRGTLLFTEASTKKRASLFVVRGEAELAAFDRGGVEPLEASLEEFKRTLTRENHTLKRVLTDPRLVSGVGNAYSDEILFHARLSPVQRTANLSDEQIATLYAACRSTLSEWVDRLRRESANAFPEKVTAFREQMAVHGRYGKPCPACGTRVQRIRFADNEANYCPRCQTGGKLLADRALSRLLKGDWPKSIDELEERLGRRPGD